MSILGSVISLFCALSILLNDFENDLTLIADVDKKLYEAVIATDADRKAEILEEIDTILRTLTANIDLAVPTVVRMDLLGHVGTISADGLADELQVAMAMTLMDQLSDLQDYIVGDPMDVGEINTVGDKSALGKMREHYWRLLEQYAEDRKSYESALSPMSKDEFVISQQIGSREGQLVVVETIGSRESKTYRIEKISFEPMDEMVIYSTGPLQLDLNRLAARTGLALVLKGKEISEIVTRYNTWFSGMSLSLPIIMLSPPEQIDDLIMRFCGRSNFYVLPSATNQNGGTLTLVYLKTKVKVGRWPLERFESTRLREFIGDLLSVSHEINQKG